MESNKASFTSFFYIAIAGILAVFLWYCTSFFSNLYDYISMNQEIMPKTIHWKIVEKNEKFYVKTHYQYEYAQKFFDGQYTFKKSFPNSYLASETINQLQLLSWKIWMNKTHPQLSTMERKFPAKALIQSLVVLCVGIYFVFLYQYLLRYEKARG